MNEAELLFSQLLSCDRASLYLNRELHLGKDEFLKASSVLKRRMSGEPLQYILGKTEFMGLEFIVDKNVFIPRPETEILVEIAAEYVTSKNILDLGTGSGCIAVSLAKLLPRARITATDISDKALRVAMKNADLNAVKVNFLQCDLFSGMRAHSYELIVSNPPYISRQEIADLQPEIRYEPEIALDGGSDGLDFYRRIVEDSTLYLKTEGYLIMEMGFGQKEGIRDIFQKNKNLEIMGIIQDYNNIDRIIIARKKRGEWTG